MTVGLGNKKNIGNYLFKKSQQEMIDEKALFNKCEQEMIDESDLYNKSEQDIMFEDYLFKKREQKNEFLKEKFNMSNLALRGQVKQLPKESENYFFIKDVMSHDEGKYIINPFTEQRIDEIRCTFNKNERELLLQRLSVGDLIKFNFEANSRGSHHLIRYKPINAKADTISKLVKIEEIKNDLGEEVGEFYQRIFNDYDFRTEQLVVEEELKDRIQSLIEKGYKNLENIQTQLKALEKSMSKKNRLLEHVTQKINVYQKLGLISEMQEKPIFKEVLQPENLSVPQVVQSYLANRETKKLYYPLSILEQFYCGLHTNQIIILSGKPGTGKTSLVEGFAEAIGAICKNIAVRPNWTDTQDLLGYYNPIDKKYIGTSFLDTIMTASNNPDQLYFICLDEMNIAYVEHYFSEILSKLYTESMELQLYSPNLAREIYEEVDFRFEMLLGEMNDTKSSYDARLALLNKVNLEEYLTIKNRLKSLQQYPPTITIPQNIKFIGTINKDESTKNISPKVIDRSFVIYLDTNNRSMSIDKDLNIERLHLKANQFILNSEIRDSIEDELCPIIKAITPLNIQVNNRNLMHISQMLSVDTLDPVNIIDYIIANKILPKVNVNLDKREGDKLSLFEELVETYPISRSIFNEMKDFWKNYSIFSYWRE